MPTKQEPDMRLRRAHNYIWELDGEDRGMCTVCEEFQGLNVLGICWACNFKAKLGTIAIVAEPWGLKEVRREYGISGESSPRDQEKKRRKWEADKEFRVTHGLPYEGEPKL